MNDGRRSSRGLTAGFAAALFSMAFAALVSSQLALMSILDVDRAEVAAEQIAASRFTADLIDRTVVRAIAPVAGDGLAQQAATVASNDPNVLGVVETSLLGAYGQIVDRDAPAETVDGNQAVGSAIVSSVVGAASQNGIDVDQLGLSAEAGFDPAVVAADAGLPQVVPTDLPRLGLRDIATTTRMASFLAAVGFACAAILISPRRGRAVRGLGIKAAVVAGAWLAVLWVAGWVIGLASDTLFGEMIQTVWSDAVPSMTLLVGAGLVLGIALILAGIAVDGFSRDRVLPRSTPVPQRVRRR